MAVVEGRLQIRDWTDKEGAKRRTAEVVADQLYFAGAKTAPPSEAMPMSAAFRHRLRRNLWSRMTRVSCPFDRLVE